ncbi:hypothetical protein ZIOFF_003815 [Zingiber officinale]|uniref:CBS domain-containing protein n=1 Tax=Zingiber officinale TaxID=94328 RepID=A0A8J5HZ25_ZINOF|nr:hypothetical protein ZIOFF_003815 [Zingiber officinale]
MAGSSSLHGTLALHFTFKSCLKRPLFASILTPTAASSKPLRSGSVKGGFRSKRGASVPSGIASATFSDDLRPGLGENPEVVISGEWPDNFSLLSYDDLRAYLETQIINEKVGLVSRILLVLCFAGVLTGSMEQMKPTATLATVMSTPVRMARPEQTLEEIDHNFEFVSGLPVIDEQLRCIGVISKKDKSRASNGISEQMLFQADNNRDPLLHGQSQSSAWSPDPGRHNDQGKRLRSSVVV